MGIVITPVQVDCIFFIRDVDPGVWWLPSTTIIAVSKRFDVVTHALRCLRIPRVEAQLPKDRTLRRRMLSQPLPRFVALCSGFGWNGACGCRVGKPDIRSRRPSMPPAIPGNRFLEELSCGPVGGIIPPAAVGVVYLVGTS